MTATGKALEVLGIDPKYCTNCIGRMMCKGKVCEMARSMVGLEINPDEICKDLVLEPIIAIYPKDKAGKQVIEQIAGFTWKCKRGAECNEREIWCPIKEERIQKIFIALIKGYNNKKDFRDHAIILPGDLVLLINFDASHHHWEKQVIQAEK